MERRFYLVDAEVLPEVFLKVVKAKELLASGEVRSISAATRSVDLSRSAFYKYKDCIFDSENGAALVAVTIRTDTMQMTPEELTERLSRQRMVVGVHCGYNL